MSVDGTFVALDAVIADKARMLGWNEEPFAEPYHRIRGELAGEPVCLATVSFTASHMERCVWARLQTADDRGVTRTIVSVPRGEGFVLGMDIVAMKGRMSLFAIDLFGTTPALDERAHATLRAAKESLQGFRERPLPEFAKGTFSSDAIVGSLSEGYESAAVPCVEQILAQAWSSIGRPDDDDAGLAKADAWLAGERANRGERNALARIFGAEIARTYLDQMVFGPTRA